MAYRDELDAAQARAEALEKQLTDARQELALVKGEASSQALVQSGKTGDRALARSELESPASRRWLGAPTQLGFSRTLAGEIPETAHTELIEKIRMTVQNVGSTTVLPGSLAWGALVAQNQAGPNVNVYISYRDGQTNIRAEQKLGNLAGGIFGGVGGGVGGGGIAAPIMLSMVSPFLVPVGIGAWLGGTYWACRKLYKSRAEHHATRLERLVDELAEIAERHIEAAAAEPEA